MRLQELANIKKVFQKVRGVKRKLQKTDPSGSSWKIGDVSSEDEHVSSEEEEEEEVEEVIEQP